MKSWEHPEVKKALAKLKPFRSKQVQLRTPNGKKEYIITYYLDVYHNIYIEIRPLDPSQKEYILVPIKVLKEILQDANINVS